MLVGQFMVNQNIAVLKNYLVIWVSRTKTKQHAFQRSFGIDTKVALWLFD